MEAIAAIFFVGLVLAAGVCILFLCFIQPIWSIVDVAVSNEHSGATKTVVILLTLLLLGPIMTFFYACFGTHSRLLRVSTLVAFALLLLVGTTAIGVALAVPAAKSIWDRNVKGQTVQVEQKDFAHPGLPQEVVPGKLQP
jgi:small-conductance mechanosensitive channel